MEWLDKKINEFEQRNRAEASANEDEVKKLQIESDKNEKAASTARDLIYKKLYELKKAILSKKMYFADLQENSLEGLVLFVNTRALRHGEKANKQNIPYLCFKHSHGNPKFTIESDDHKDKRNKPKQTTVEISTISDEYVDKLTQEFIENIFS